MTPQEAIELYDDALTDFAQSMASIAEFIHDRDEMKRVMTSIAAEVAANGGWEETAIDGKNAEVRAAQLAVILGRHPEHCKSFRAHHKAVSDLAEAEARRDTAAEQMRFCRAVLAYETARLQREAYAHGGDGIRD